MELKKRPTSPNLKEVNGIWYDNSGDMLRVQRAVHTQEFNMQHYHMHTTYEIHIALSGHTILECGTLAAELHGPYVAVHRPYIPHRTNALFGEVPYFRFILNFTEEYLQRTAQWISALQPLFDHTFYAFEFPPECTELLQSRLEDAHRMYEAKRSSTCQLAVAMALDEIAVVAEKGHIKAAGGITRYLDEVIRFIIAHISEKISCTEVAEHFFISESKLARDFKQCFGLAFNQYITQLRVKMAKDLLAHGENGASAAKACGFCTPSYFISVFKKYIGQTPAEYAASLRNELN